MSRSLLPDAHRSPTMLLFEEDEDARAAYAMVLAELGIDVACASDVDEAGALLKAVMPAAVLLEWRALRCDGTTTAQLVAALRRLDPLGAARPIVVFSATLDLADAARSLGARHCSLPFDLDRLFRVIARASGMLDAAIGPGLARTAPTSSAGTAIAR